MEIKLKALREKLGPSVAKFSSEYFEKNLGTVEPAWRTIVDALIQLLRNYQGCVAKARKVLVWPSHPDEDPTFKRLAYNILGMQSCDSRKHMSQELAIFVCEEMRRYYLWKLESCDRDFKFELSADFVRELKLKYDLSKTSGYRFKDKILSALSKQFERFPAKTRSEGVTVNNLHKGHIHVLERCWYPASAEVARSFVRSKIPPKTEMLLFHAAVALDKRPGVPNLTKNDMSTLLRDSGQNLQVSSCHKKTSRKCRRHHSEKATAKC